MPARLVGRETATGIIGKRIGAIFRDRDELPVAADLSGEINQALDASQFLIVLCSPKSAASKWVNQEVINFKRLKGAASIIAVIVSGEPGSGGDTECFCPGLRFQVGADGTLSDTPAEPIAADLRPGKDPARLVKMKVLAGLLGLGLDELIRRDNARRQKITAYAMAASVAGMAVMTALAWSAVVSRNDAERRGRKAEELMEFLLTKMQVPLREVGRLKEFNEAVDRTVGYYGTEKLENLRDESLSRYGRALHLETETRQLEGRFDDALKAAIVAAEMTGAVLRRAPSEPERVSDHGQSEFWLGNLTLARNPREAISHFASYVDLTEQARKARPDMLAWQANAARAHNSLALALFRAGDLDPSLAEFTLANATWAQIRKDHPDDHQARQAAANTLNLTSDVLKAQGKMQAAVAVQEQSLALTEPAYILDKNDRDAQYRLATVERRIARLAFEVGDAARSLDHLEKARDHGIELLQHDPENILWQDSLAMTVADFAAAEVLTGSLAKAAAELGRPESSRVLTTGAKLGVWNNRLQALIAARAADARVSMAHGEVRRAVALAEANARDLSVLSGTPPPDAVVATGETEIMLGDALDQAGDKEAALSHWRNAERLQDRPLGLRATYVAMQALCRRGDGSGASTLAAELKAAGYARSLSAAVIDKCRK